MAVWVNHLPVDFWIYSKCDIFRWASRKNIVFDAFMSQSWKKSKKRACFVSCSIKSNLPSNNSGTICKPYALEASSRRTFPRDHVDIVWRSSFRTNNYCTEASPYCRFFKDESFSNFQGILPKMTLSLLLKAIRTARMKHLQVYTLYTYDVIVMVDIHTFLYVILVGEVSFDLDSLEDVSYPCSSLTVDHQSRPGLLSMANRGRNSNGSQAWRLKILRKLEKLYGCFRK